MLTKLNKRGQLGNLQSLTIGLVVTSLVLVVGFKILASVKAGLTAGSTEANATQSVIDAIDDNIVGNIGRLCPSV
jgi:uncharacterized protein (UPF0333 family)|tara:strand:- start:314 stop:538 length:225 start_codon:yes stop_codon:yes gene_type:complete